ncbi:MAG: hypothetical protein M3Q55_05155, partial [Acidobacteriota bacterium]|nr:hypothetical protein [Acidobacteriota bacterium]
MRLKFTHCALACAIVAAPAAGAFAQTQPATAHPAGHHANATQNRKTTVEFRTATRLPGITLQPGSYVFKMRNTNGKQHFVDVYSSDGTQKIATLLTVDYPAAATSGSTTVLYPNTSPTLRAWYFPGEPVGRAFVYSQDEARTLYTSAQTPVLWAAYDPNDTTTVFEVNTYDQNVAGQVADAAKAVGRAAVNVAKDVADKAEDVWDDATDNAKLVNPTDSRKMAERHLDAAEQTYDHITDRLDDSQEAPLMPMRARLEALEDAFEKNDGTWMTHYHAALAALDRLSPERPVGTSGGTVMI